MDEMVRNVETARQHWNRGNLAGYLELYDPAIKLHGYSPEPLDKAAVKTFYETIWSSLGAEGKPNPQLEFHEILCNGGLYCCRFTMSGIHRGPFLGIAATGRPYALPGITIMRFGGDKRTVVERFSCADMLGLLVQVGAIATPG
jgi:predicted ester cyclase